MNSKRINDKIKTLFPCEWADDFMGSIDLLFKNYLDFLVEEECPSNTMEDIRNSCKVIVDAVSFIFDGCHGEAFNAFSKLMNGASDIHASSPGLLSLPNSIQICEGDHWYRARKSEDKMFSVLDLFHIPLNKRGKVSTQRYSCPGFPCLYLSSSTYGCWEELGRLGFDTLFFSSFRVRNTFRVLDLRIPDVENYDDSQLNKALKLLPLIIACSFRVNNPKDDFKPEYIIPQLLLETIINNNHYKTKVEKTYLDEDIIWGILYSSSHNNDFVFDSKYLYNIVMPVIETQNKNNYCSYLASSFDISIPTCFEYESLKVSILRRPFCDDSDFMEEDDSTQYYRNTKMGYLESILRNAEYKTLPHLVLFAPKEGLMLNSRGDPVNLVIRSSEEYHIEY